ncbi:Uncharacterised protein [Streptococcus pneumoniae]|nr:Uncharacterised protein [Streptococcus pneumoniae]CKH11194.1 Uncharacterised protein [Streptococcus pneumoniae]
MDDKRIGNGNAEPDVEYHLPDYHHTNHLPAKENRYKKNGLGFDGFDQCAGEYRPSEYFHKKLQSCMKYGHTFRL